MFCVTARRKMYFTGRLQYTYDAGDNLKTKVAPWVDDFQDGNITGWSGDTGNYSVASGVMENTLDASAWRDIYLSESYADVDLRFDYIRYSTTGTSQAHVRYTDLSNRVYVEFLPTSIRLRQKDGGVLTSLDSINTTVAEDTWYTVRVVADGGDVTVYWGEKGGDSTEILSTASATVTATSTAAYLRAGPNSEHGWDNVHVIAGTLGTSTTFTHNDANELTSTTTNGVTTDYEYDEWGRLTEKDDGTHTATYAYRYGSKLYSVTSDFPGEGNVTYETGGDKKVRSRVAGADEAWYNYTVAFDVVSTEDDADGSTGTLTMTNVVHAQISATLGDLAGANPSSGTARYYTTDHLGSTRSVWDAVKANVGTYEFTPYGSEYHHTGSNLATLAGTFTGKPWDKDAQLLLFPFRAYSPLAARWTTRDPLGIVDGPNIYSYVTRNPINLRDFLGLHATETSCAIATAGCIAAGIGAVAACFASGGLVCAAAIMGAAVVCSGAAYECQQVGRFPVSASIEYVTYPAHPCGYCGDTIPESSRWVLHLPTASSSSCDN